MRVVITAKGHGTRMKGLSPLPKHHLYYKDKKIIDHLLSIYPEAEVLDGEPDNSRRETLGRIKDYTDCLIIDCDIILTERLKFDHTWNCLFYFESNKDKYSSINVENGVVVKAKESPSLSNHRCSGVYFVKSIFDLLHIMKTDSIAEAMTLATAYPEDVFIIRINQPCPGVF